MSITSSKIMDFSAYPEFQARFQKQYGWMEESFPFSLMVLEGELRNCLSGDEAISRHNISRLTKHYIPIDLLLQQVSLRRFDRPQIYIEMPGFQPVRGPLTKRLRQQGHMIFSDRKFFGVPANRALHKMATMGRAFPRAMELASRQSLEALLADRQRLVRLEASLLRNHARLLRFIEAQRIKLFVATGDSKPFSRLIAKAAKDLGRPYIVLAHGYISNPVLNTIAPIRADRLIAWTGRQRQMLQEVLPERKDDILCHGFPERVTLPANIAPERRILFAWEPLERTGHEAAHQKVLSTLAAACRQADVTPAFRPHPKERRNADLLQRMERLGFEIDQGPLGHALARAACVVSSNSTVLTEAAAAAVPAYQVAELAAFRFEGAQMIPAAALDPSALISAPKRKTPLQPMNHEALFNDINELLGDAHST